MIIEFKKCTKIKINQESEADFAALWHNYYIILSQGNNTDNPADLF